MPRDQTFEASGVAVLVRDRAFSLSEGTGFAKTFFGNPIYR
jgi:hypothetical protein